MNAVERRRRLEALFALHASAVRAYAARRFSAAEVDDVTSDVLVVWRRLEDVPEDALPWLLACARRVVANRRRSRRRQAALHARLSRERSRVAVVVGCSPRAFAMRLHRARRRLAAAMGELDRAALDRMEAMR
jgi:RNA polymerase sigma-70 factor, ECF subfamily